MEVIIAANRVAVIKSAFTLGQLKTVKRVKPSALYLKDADGNPVFKVGIGKGVISESGVEFDANGAENEPAKLVVALDVGPEVADLKAWFIKTCGGQLAKLKAVEEGLHETLADAERESAEIMRLITVVG